MVTNNETPREYAVLLPFAPDQVPAHMDLWGNVNRWSSSASILIFGALFSFAMFVMLWASVIAKYRYGGKIGAIASLFLVPFYFLYLFILLGITSATPYTTNIYAGINWDFGKVVTGLCALGLTVLGVLAHMAKPTGTMGIRNRWTLASSEVWDYTHGEARLALVVGGGLNYLILAGPPIPALGRVSLSCLVSLILYGYLRYKSNRKYQTVVQDRNPENGVLL
ncbi:MAG: Uncharacterized protein FD169_1825 [Bacillota bacterium]|nr:MAG: Uncharacterized protein FD169_1825 [Bacillota bacterium]